MEFFSWLGDPLIFMQIFKFDLSTPELLTATLQRLWLICLISAGALFLVGLIFGGIGLYVMAKRAGVAHAWLGFVPFANTYLAGKLAGETGIFGKRMKNVGLYAMLAEIVYVGLNSFILYMNLCLCDAKYYAPILAEDGVTLEGWSYPSAQVPDWIKTGQTVCGFINYLFVIVMIFFFCALFFAFFRKYFARSPYLMTFLCAILPLRGFVLFAVRKNAPVDYAAYMHRRTNGQAGGYGGYGGGSYGGSYGGYGGSYGGYRGDAQGSRPEAPEEPFSEFGRGGGNANGNPDSNGNSGNDTPFSDF